MRFTCALYGDSISTGTHGEGAYAAALVAAGAEPLYVHAVGGSGLALGSQGSLVDVLANSEARHDDLDVALVWHGSNDWYWGSPLGEDDSTDPATYRGAWRHCVEILRAQVPELPIVAPLPLWRDERPDGGAASGAAHDTPNRRGLRLGDYAAALAGLAGELDLQLVDAGRAAGLGPALAELAYEDRVHPNRLGYDLLQPHLVRAVKAALPR